MIKSPCTEVDTPPKIGMAARGVCNEEEVSFRFPEEYEWSVAAMLGIWEIQPASGGGVVEEGNIQWGDTYSMKRATNRFLSIHTRKCLLGIFLSKGEIQVAGK